MASPDTDKDFRRRRLSIPLFQMMNAEGDDGTPSSPCAARRTKSPPQMKDSSFRKRRLSLTNVTSQKSITSPTQQVQVSPSPQKKKPRVVVANTSHRARKKSSSSNIATGRNHPPGLLPSRTLHSAELNGDDDDVYSGRVPSNVFHHGSQQHQPRWKRRMTLDVISDADKLPFPPDIVGTYSYHGIEPAYDDGEEDEEEEETEKKGTHHMLVPTLQQLLENSHSEAGSSFLFPAENTTDGDDIPGIVSAPSESIAKINQDRGGVVYPYANSPTTALFAVYDGHGQGGELISQFALTEVQHRLSQHPQFRSNVTQAFTDTFQAVDDALCDEPLIEPLFAGTTACVALVDGRNLYTSNLGDSRAVCARRCRCRTGMANQEEEWYDDYQAIDLTVDQNPDNPVEQRRIEAAGGYVTPPPAPGLSARVWLDRACTQVGLAMARSLGDHAAATVGVIAEPVTTVHRIDPNDDFLILATDGVWEFLSSQQAVDIVKNHMKEGATVACQALIKAAAKRWQEEEGSYRDDITAIVVKLQHLWDLEPTT